MTLNVIFLGTPEFAVPSFRALLADPTIDVLGAMTQPDRPSGRGQKLTPPPVKVVAEEAGVPLRQPHRLRKEPDMIAWLQELKPDFLVTAAFGQILSQEVLDIPKYGTVNVHASLLPRYRGPNPVQWSILNGDKTTGVTTMLTVLGVDAGPMLLQAETTIEPLEDAATLTQRLAELGAEILPTSLHQYALGALLAQEQDPALVTHAPKLIKEDAGIDWSQSAMTIHNKIRGQQPWPGASTHLDSVLLKLYKTQTEATWKDSKHFVKRGKPGEILDIIKEGLVVATGTEPILVETLQPPGKPKMVAADWANGMLRQLPSRQFSSINRVEVS